jgi:uncharacterized protein YkwD
MLANYSLTTRNTNKNPKTSEITNPNPSIEVVDSSPNVPGVLSQAIENPKLDEPVAATVKKPVPVPQPNTTPQAIPKVATTNCTTGAFSTQFLCLLNEYRKSKGLNSLTFEKPLNLAATAHATWMNANSTLSHEGLNNSKFYERCADEGTSCDAENVARGYTTPKTLLNAWIASASHNKNLLGSHTVIGVALVGNYSDLLMR